MHFQDACANLGDFLILLHASSKYTFASVAACFLEVCAGEGLSFRGLNQVSMQEVDARNVRWMLDKVCTSDVCLSAPSRAISTHSLGRRSLFPNRLGLTFAGDVLCPPPPIINARAPAAETSVRLVSFQIRFLALSRNTDLSLFVDGNSPPELIKALKDIHSTVKAQKNWGDYIRVSQAGNPPLFLALTAAMFTRRWDCLFPQQPKGRRPWSLPCA